jgi:hypothetical protein
MWTSIIQLERNILKFTNTPSALMLRSISGALLHINHQISHVDGAFWPPDYRAAIGKLDDDVNTLKVGMQYCVGYAYYSDSE